MCAALLADLEFLFIGRLNVLKFMPDLINNVFKVTEWTQKLYVGVWFAA